MSFLLLNQILQNKLDFITSSHDVLIDDLEYRRKYELIVAESKRKYEVVSATAQTDGQNLGT